MWLRLSTDQVSCTLFRRAGCRKGTCLRDSLGLLSWGQLLRPAPCGRCRIHQCISVTESTGALALNDLLVYARLYCRVRGCGAIGGEKKMMPVERVRVSQEVGKRSCVFSMVSTDSSQKWSWIRLLVSKRWWPAGFDFTKVVGVIDQRCTSCAACPLKE